MGTLFSQNLASDKMPDDVALSCLKDEIKQNYSHLKISEKNDMLKFLRGSYSIRISFFNNKYIIETTNINSGGRILESHPTQKSVINYIDKTFKDKYIC